MTLVSKTKPDRHRIDLSNDSVARHWAKKLGHSREEIAAAVEKVGDNCETVRKELKLAAAKAAAKAEAKADAVPVEGAMKVATAT